MAKKSEEGFVVASPADAPPCPPGPAGAARGRARGPAADIKSTTDFGRHSTGGVGVAAAVATGHLRGARGCLRARPVGDRGLPQAAGARRDLPALVCLTLF